MRRRTTIGKLGTRLQLEAAQDDPDDTGAFTRSWVPIASLWGRIVPREGDERFPAGAIEVAISHDVTIRRRVGVVNGMRFVLGARVLLIRAVTDVGDDNPFLLCRCEEIAA